MRKHPVLKVLYLPRMATLLLFLTGLALGGCAFDPEAPGYEGDGSGWELAENQEEPGADDGAGDGIPGDSEPGEGDPGDGEPTDPGDGEPTEPGDGEPTEPGDGEPTEPGDDEPDPEVICDGEVVDTDVDPNHCGSCGNGCDPDFGSCESGVCACPAGYEACGSTNRCENIERDARHCGGCGVECGPGMRCVNGECVCRPGLSLCGGECVDTSRDPNHCGGCEQSCGFGACEDSQCDNSCGFGAWECRPSGDDGIHCMRATTANSLYCAPTIQNSCGEVCTGSELCRTGMFDRGCRAYRPGRGCEACPCEDCEESEICRELEDALGGVVCIEE